MSGNETKDIIEGEALPDIEESSKESAETNSEENKDTENSEAGKVPGAVKILIAVLVIVVVLAVSIGVKFIISHKKEKEAKEIAKQEQQLPIGHGNIDSKNGLDQANIVKTPSFYDSVDTIKKDLRTEFESRIEAQEKSINKIDQKLSELINAISENNSFEEISKLEEALAETKEQIRNINKEETAQLRGEINNIAQQIKELKIKTDKTNISVTALKNISINSPSFTLLSVDEWGDSKQAVLEMKGYTSLASVNDVRAGWRIVEIHKTYIKCIRIKDGLEYILHRKGGK